MQKFKRYHLRAFNRATPSLVPVSIVVFLSKQSLGDARRNALPTKRIQGVLMMRHQHSVYSLREHKIHLSDINGDMLLIGTQW
jgi:hypothetical protein